MKKFVWVNLCPISIFPFTEKKKRKVAGYAAYPPTMTSSLQTTRRIDCYTNYISSREAWEFVAVYTDEGNTAASLTTIGQ